MPWQSGDHGSGETARRLKKVAAGGMIGGLGGHGGNGLEIEYQK
jgi:GTPase involved in cell partitioning and DNA repair